MALDTNTLADNVDIEIPWSASCPRMVPLCGLTIKPCGCESADDADEKRESSSFWLVVTARNGGSSIAGENGQVYRAECLCQDRLV